MQVQENIFKNMYPGQNSQLNPEAGMTSWMPFIIQQHVFACYIISMATLVEKTLLALSTSTINIKFYVLHHLIIVVVWMNVAGKWEQKTDWRYHNLPKLSPPSKISPPPSSAKSYCKGSLLFKSTPTPQTRLATHSQTIRMTLKWLLSSLSGLLLF